MAMKAMQGSAGPGGLIPTSLVFGTLQKIGQSTNKPTKSRFQRAVALRNATASVSKHFGKDKFAMLFAHVMGLMLWTSL